MPALAKSNPRRLAAHSTGRPPSEAFATGRSRRRGWMHLKRHHLMSILAPRLEVGLMRTTMALDDELVAQAQGLTGLKEKSALVREALKALIERESARRWPVSGAASLTSKRRGAVGQPIRDPRRYVGLGRSPASGQRDAGSIARSGRGSGPSIRDRRNLSEQSPPARPRVDGAVPPSRRQSRDRRRSFALHRQARALWTFSRIRRWPSPRRGQPHRPSPLVDI